MYASDLSTFPLLKLPIEAQKLVVRMLLRLHQLTLSTFNDNTKQLVTSSGITCNHFYFSLNPGTQIGIGYDDGDFVVLEFEEAFPGEYRKLNQSCITARYEFGEDDYEDDVHEWDKYNFVVRDWIKHLFQVLNRTHIDMMFSSDATYQLSDIQWTFKIFKIKEIQAVFGSISLPTLLENLPPVSTVGCRCRNWISDKEFSKILIQNYEEVEPGMDQKITLDQLLLSNCVRFETYNHNLTPRDLNRFLKIWMNSKLCTRLRYLHVGFCPKSRSNGFPRIMCGIKYRVSNEKRVFQTGRQYVNEPHTIDVNRGINIYRKDGTEATIMITLVRNSFPKFEMLIWS
ncbi:unnamed protein product [Caenorhabditis brenneri]